MKKKTATFLRVLCGCRGKRYPIVLVAGCQPPSLTGEPWHHVNSVGDVIRHPGAYRAAWGKPIYVHSTRRIEVGTAWVKALEHLGLDCPLGIVSDYALDSEGVCA